MQSKLTLLIDVGDNAMYIPYHKLGLSNLCMHETNMWSTIAEVATTTNWFFPSKIARRLSSIQNMRM